jgi:hypothetical protein
LGFTNWPVFLLHQLATIKFSGTIITEPSTSFLAPLPGTEEEEAPTSNTHSPVNLAPSNAINQQYESINENFGTMHIILRMETMLS